MDKSVGGANQKPHPLPLPNLVHVGIIALYVTEQYGHVTDQYSHVTDQYGHVTEQYGHMTEGVGSRILV